MGNLLSCILYKFMKISIFVGGWLAVKYRIRPALIALTDAVRNKISNCGTKREYIRCFICFSTSKNLWWGVRAIWDKEKEDRKKHTS